MAATNYTPIQLYYSTTASAVPLAANLAQGELAINITDGKLYYEDNGGVVQVIATKGAGTIGGSTTQIQYNNAGALAGNAAMVFNNSTNVTTLTTLNLTNALGAIYGGTAQSTYTQGDVLYASASNTLAKLGIGTVNYILTSSGSVPQWSAPSSISVLTATNLAGGLAGSVPYQSALDTTTFLAIGAANRVMTSTGSAPQWVTSLTSLTGVSSSSITNTSLTSGRVVFSGASGLESDSASLTFNGTTLSAGGFSTTGLSTLVQTVKIGDSNFSGVAVFAPATPAKLYMGTGTVTDVTSAVSATNTTGAIASLAITPIAATNTGVTYTNASTLYIAGAPSAGTNVTITNPYSLYVAAGDAYFGGTVTAGTVNLTTLDLTNLEVTNIKAKDGTAAMTIADSTGVVSLTANPILSGGTANGVAYLNGSKVLTTGSALVFDGTSFLDLKAGANQRFYRSDNTRYGFIYADNNGLNIGATSANGEELRLSATGAQYFYVGATPTIAMTIASATGGVGAVGIGYTSLTSVGNNGLAVLGNVGIGTNGPNRKLYVQSDDSATGGNVVAVRNSNSTAGAFINFLAGGGNAPSMGAKGNDLVFTADGYAGTEWGRFTSSNFLVGATSSSGLVGNNAYIVGGNFSTVNGADSITTTPTTVTTLPSRDGATYLFSAQNISDANTTSYGVVALITQQGTALVQTDLKTASFSVITISGLNIQITSTLATKIYRWSLVRIM